MATAEILDLGDYQAVKLPVEFHIDGETVSIRREGDALILEPMAGPESSPSAWPEGFFDQIHVDDPNFVRPDQGQLPPAPNFS
jgi:virulence-associated protein VagC